MGKAFDKDVTAALNGSAVLNSTSFVKILDANPDRLYLNVSVAGKDDIYINFRAVADALDDTGIWVSGFTGWETRTENIYTGEVCAIAVASTPSVAFLEY